MIVYQDSFYNLFSDLHSILATCITGIDTINLGPLLEPPIPQQLILLAEHLLCEPEFLWLCDHVGRVADHDVHAVRKTQPATDITVHAEYIVLGVLYGAVLCGNQRTFEWNALRRSLCRLRWSCNISCSFCTNSRNCLLSSLNQN